MIGKQFGRLTVIAQAETRKYLSGKRYYRWECECSCGKRIIVFGHNLRSGKTTSCGCWHSEVMKVVARQNFSKHGKGLSIEHRQKLSDKQIAYQLRRRNERKSRGT